MGHRTIQRILECGWCNKIPDDGTYLWEMSGIYMCQECSDSDKQAPDGYEANNENK